MSLNARTPDYSKKIKTLNKADSDAERKAFHTNKADSDVTSPINKKLEALQDSFRKVLSPISSNINIGKLSSNDQMCLVLYDLKTPKATHSCFNDMFQENVTPLGKFTAESSNLKNSLVQQYIDFLNTASKEELLELKVNNMFGRAAKGLFD